MFLLFKRRRQSSNQLNIICPLSYLSNNPFNNKQCIYINLLALELFFFKFQHILYIKCE